MLFLYNKNQITDYQIIDFEKHQKLPFPSVKTIAHVQKTLDKKQREEFHIKKVHLTLLRT